MKPTDPTPTKQVLEQIRSVKAREALARWLEGHTATVTPARWTGEGYTGAQVLGVYLHDYLDHPSGVIIKVIEKAKQGNRDKEFKAHKLAYKDSSRDSPQFAEDHLAELIGDMIPLDDGGSIMFQRVVGGGFKETKELDKALIDSLDPAAACRDIASALLNEWNTYSTSPPQNIGAVFDELLNKRHAPGGTIAAWASRHDGLLDTSRKWLSPGGGQRLINPFALGGQTSLSSQLPDTMIMRGKSHGDLHPGNVLAGMKAGRFSYFLVDLARYSASGLLSWDPVYLTLTTVAKFLPAVNFHSREKLQRWVIDPTGEPDPAWPRPLRAIGAGVHQGTDDWARQKGLVPVWETQRLLCLTAVALILTGRDRLLTPEDRTWFFWLAARAATQLVLDSTDLAPENPLTLPESLIVGDVINLDDHRTPTSDTARSSEAVQVGEEAESWNELVAELRVVQLDAPDPATLTAHTETLRSRLAHTLRTSGGYPGESIDLFAELAATLDEAIQPGATSFDARAACHHAELLRTWILGPLS